MISNKLISHQVFEAIQGGVSDSPLRNGKILFANKYTGEPVSMDPEIRAALNHDGVFIGNNPINQLEKALAGVPGGPWVIDIRNEIVYIHNKPLDQPAVYDYVYGSENGELLSVSFKTSYRTKNAPRGGTMTIDQFKKTLRVHSTSQTQANDIIGDATDKTAIRTLYSRANQARTNARVSTMYPSRNSGGGVSYKNTTDLKTLIQYINSKSGSNYSNLESLYEMDLETLSSWYDQYINYLNQSINRALDNYEKTASSEDLNYLQLKKSSEVYSSQSFESFKPYVANFLNDVIGDKNTRYRREVEDELKKAFKEGPESVQNVLHRYFDNTTYSQYTHDGAGSVKDVDVKYILGSTDRRIEPASANSGTIKYDGANGTFIQKGENAGTGSIISGVSNLLYSIGYRNISLKAYDIRPYTVFGAVTGSQCKLKVSYRQTRRNYHTISGYKFMYDFYTRYTGSDEGRYTQYVRGQALGSNTSRKVTEKRLEVEMLVVGRPSLTSSGKIKISNIGYRSGDYIIKRCIHQITPGEGYTCSLTLEQGSHNEPIGTVDSEIPITSKPGNTGGGTNTGGGNRTRNDGRDGTISTTPIEPVVIWVTPAERAYFETLLLAKDAVSAQEEFVTQIKYSREQAYVKAKQSGKSDAEAKEAVRRINQTGIVSIKNKHVSSDNLYFKENLSPHYQQVPARYRVAYRDEVRRILSESINGIKAKLN